MLPILDLGFWTQFGILLVFLSTTLRKRIFTNHPQLLIYFLFQLWALNKRWKHGWYLSIWVQRCTLGKARSSPKSKSICDIIAKLARIGQNLAFPVLKSTPPPVETIVTNISYAWKRKLLLWPCPSPTLSPCYSTNCKWCPLSVCGGWNGGQVWYSHLICRYVQHWRYHSLPLFDRSVNCLPSLRSWMSWLWEKRPGNWQRGGRWQIWDGNGYWKGTRWSERKSY